MSNRIRSSLARLERELGVTTDDDDTPKPTPEQAADRNRFREVLRTLTQVEQDWVMFALHGFKKPPFAGTYCLHPNDPYPHPPWAYDPPPPIPDWLPGVLVRLGVLKPDVIRALEQGGFITRTDNE